MKRFAKIFLVFVLVLSALLLVACGNAGSDEETDVPSTTAPTETTKNPDETTVADCSHPNLKTTNVPPTCLEDGLVDRICEDCGYWLHVDKVALGHSFKTEYNFKLGYETGVCTQCGVSGYLLEPDQSVVFDGEFGGDACFLAQSVFEDSGFELVVDGVSSQTIECQTTDTEVKIPDGVHTVTFTNLGTNTIIIGEKNMENTLSRKSSVIVEVLKGSANAYNSINFYVQTADPSGEYYVRYKMQYEYSNVRDNYNANSTTNISNYRIKTAQLVKLESLDGNVLLGKDMFEVLQTGEISLAAKEINVKMDTLTQQAKTMVDSQKQAADFVGGYHGDERLESVELLVDGELINIYGQTEGRVIPCLTAAFNQTATIYAWGTSTADSFGKEMMLHSQNFVFGADGVSNHQSVEWLDNGFEMSVVYLEMFTMRREINGQVVCENIAALDAEGNVLDAVKVPIPVTKQTNYLSNLNNRTILYSSDISGVSARAGFEILNSSVVPDNIHISARTSQGDNKLYAAFISATNGNKPKKGEVWEVMLRYHIDYTAPAENQ